MIAPNTVTYIDQIPSGNNDLVIRRGNYDDPDNSVYGAFAAAVLSSAEHSVAAERLAYLHDRYTLTAGNAPVLLSQAAAFAIAAVEGAEFVQRPIIEETPYEPTAERATGWQPRDVDFELITLIGDPDKGTAFPLTIAAGSKEQFQRAWEEGERIAGGLDPQQIDIGNFPDEYTQRELARLNGLEAAYSFYQGVKSVRGY